MRLTQDLQIPSLRSLGFSHEEVPLLADLAYKDPQTIGNPRKLGLEDYVGIYQRAFDLA